MKRSMTIVALLIAPLTTQLDAQASPARSQRPPGEPLIVVDGVVQPSLAQQAAAQQGDPFARFLFPPELVMQHQSEIGLQDAQRAALQQAIQQAQAKFVDVQWKLSAEGEKLARLLPGATVDEAQVLEQVDRILALEREMKRAQMGLMIRIKNTLTAAQQAKLRELRDEPRR